MGLRMLFSCFFLAILFFFLFHLPLAITDLINYFLHILIGIDLFLIHIHHLLRGNHLLLLFYLLLLNGTRVLFFCHLVLLLVIFRGILYQVSIFTNIHWYVSRCIWFPITRWRNVLSFVTVIKWYTLYTKRKCLKTCSKSITDKEKFPS